jgi:hypothetical protein
MFFLSCKERDDRLLFLGSYEYFCLNPNSGSPQGAYVSSTYAGVIGRVCVCVCCVCVPTSEHPTNQPTKRMAWKCCRMDSCHTIVLWEQQNLETIFYGF